jgi:hypothetical protein
MSPFLKWSRCTRNRKPRTVCSRPSRPVFNALYGFKYSSGAWFPLINHVSLTAGFDRPDVQLTLTLSPIWYLARPPVILGSISGSTICGMKGIEEREWDREWNVRKCQKHSRKKFLLFCSSFDKENSIILHWQTRLWDLSVQLLILGELSQGCENG